MTTMTKEDSAAYNNRWVKRDLKNLRNRVKYLEQIIDQASNCDVYDCYSIITQEAEKLT